MPGLPQITVVIPTRDRWPVLARTLRGVLAQEDVDVEVIVVDDGSASPIPGEVERAAGTRVSAIRNEVSRGVSAARNVGLAQASCEWVAFADDDDLWSPRKLRMQFDAAEGSAAIFAYSSAVEVDSDLRVLMARPAPDSETLARQLLRVNTIPASGSNVLASTAAVRRLGGFDENLSHLADWDMWIRLADSGPGASCQDVLVAYLVHAGNMLVSRDRDPMADFRRLVGKHRERARERGTDFDGADFTRYVAHGHRRAGRRLRAIRTYLAGAFAYRSPGNVVRAFGTILGERAMARFAPPVPGRTPDPAVWEPPWLELYR